MSWQVIQIVLAVIGAVASGWFLIDQIRRRWRLTWRTAEKAAAKIVTDMNRNNFSPSLIFGIGRGGAIMGALVSGVLGHRPLIVVDRKYEWVEGRRTEDLSERLKLTASLDRVLLIAGEVHSGNTMRLYHDYLTKLGANEVHRATLYYQRGATEPVEYKGFESARADLRLPWMFTQEYRRDDRGEAEARALRGAPTRE